MAIRFFNKKRLDLSTGTISIQKPKKNQITKTNKTKNNNSTPLSIFQPEPTIIYQQIDSQKIAQEVILLLSNFLKTLKNNSNSFDLNNKENNIPIISIDESIADVGIGEQKELIIGKESAKLTKDEKSEDNLQSAIDKLKQLKGK